MPYSTDLYARWLLGIKDQQFFHAGQRVGVAVSGGPDSVLLLHFMHRLASAMGLTLAAMHFNHHLRGSESDGDEEMVRELAASLKVEYLRAEAEVGRLARERRGNIEAVARELRYRFFFSLVDQGRLDRVATAHTANDQAETVLMRLFRGAGTRGLGGIYPDLDGKVVRPFLGLTRGDVMQELAARQIAYRVDSSNLDIRLRRNKIRWELLPLLAKEYNPEIVLTLNRFADRARDEEACLERMARDRAQPWRVRDGQEERIPVRALAELPAALARRVLRQMIQGAVGSAKSLTHSHIESLHQFASEAQSGKTLVLPGGTHARKEFSWLVVGPQAIRPEFQEFSYSVTVPGELLVGELGRLFRFKIVTRSDVGKAYNLRELSGLDPQKLSGELILRNWQAGDSICPIGSRGIRRLKELFRERKIPEALRKGWPVLLCEGRVVWLRGFPAARHVAATEQSQHVLIVEEEPAHSS